MRDSYLCTCEQGRRPSCGLNESPHFPLDFSISAATPSSASNMLTRTRQRKLANPPPPHFIAALLPAEIVDCVFSHFDHVDESRQRIEREFGWASADKFKERRSALDELSTVVSSWTGSARRLLVKDIKIHTMKQLKTVPNWIGVDVKVLDLDFSSSHFKPTKTETTENLAMENLVFALLQRLPGLTTLTLNHLHFTSFTDAHSRIIRSPQFLPNLSDLRLKSSKSNFRAIAIELLDACQIARFEARSYAGAGYLGSGTLEFGRRLRYLDANRTKFVEALFDPAGARLESLVGFQELAICGGVGVTKERTRKLFDVIRPSLERLKIGHGDTQYFQDHLLDLVHLRHLTLRKPLGEVLKAPGYQLPPLLSFLSLSSDRTLQSIFDQWKATPAMAPANLQDMQIDYFYDLGVLKNCPPLIKVTTECWVGVQVDRQLQELAPGSLQFEVLEIKFGSGCDDVIERVRVECERIGVTFRPIRK